MTVNASGREGEKEVMAFLDRARNESCLLSARSTDFFSLSSVTFNRTDVWVARLPHKLMLHQ